MEVFISVLIYSLCCLSFDKVTQIRLSDGSPTAISTNIKQNIFVAVGKGKILQFDSIGKPIAHCSPTQVAEVSVLEARFGMRVFAFSQDLQSFTVYNRFLQPIEQYRLPAEKIGFAQTVAWSADQTMWIWDSQEALLKRFNPMTQEILFQVNLWQALPADTPSMDIVRMQEFENRLYVFTTSQVFVLDMWGNWLQTLNAPPLACLHEGKLWHYAGKKLVSTNLYKTYEQETIEGKLPEDMLFLCLMPQRLWTFENALISLWKK